MKWAFEDENDFGILKQIRYKLLIMRTCLVVVPKAFLRKSHIGNIDSVQ